MSKIVHLVALYSILMCSICVRLTSDHERERFNEDDKGELSEVMLYSSSWSAQMSGAQNAESIIGYCEQLGISMKIKDHQFLKIVHNMVSSSPTYLYRRKRPMDVRTVCLLRWSRIDAIDTLTFNNPVYFASGSRYFSLDSNQFMEFARFLPHEHYEAIVESLPYFDQWK